MNYSTPRSSAPVLRIDGVEYDVSNLLIQPEKHDDRPHRSQSLRKERSSPYIGNNTKAKSLMSMDQEKKTPPSHQYSRSSQKLKSPPPPTPVQEEEEIRRARRETYDHTTTVEIAPDVYEILRGAVETRQAIQSGAITQIRCCCCTQTVQCIEDAAFFICPTCSVISQVPHGSWGVGLGFVP
jgi:hypothetical protein